MARPRRRPPAPPVASRAIQAVPSSPSLGEAVADAVHTGTWWSAVARNAIPVLGVAFLGWSPIQSVLVYLFESWFYLTGRAALDITFDPKYAGARARHRPRGAIARDFLTQFAVAGVLFALLVGWFGGAVLYVVFPREEWRAFLGGAHWTRSLLLGLGGVALTLGRDLVAAGRTLDQRSAEQRLLDDYKLNVALARVGGLAGATIALGVAASYGAGGAAVVAVMAALMIYFEGVPAHAASMLGVTASGTQRPSRADG